MKTIHLKAMKESWESQREAGRYNPATTVSWNGSERVLSCGDSDWVYFFEENGALYVVSINFRLGYCGLEIFEGEERDSAQSVFCQSEEELREAAGPRGLDYSPMTLAKRLSEYALIY